MGLPPDLKVIAEGMIKASMGMVDTVMVGTRDTAIALFHELDRQHGMAGDDDAGRAFAKVYKSAAATALDVAACNQLAKACDRYADHVEAAKKKIIQDQVDPFHMDMPWDSPMFGGNGDDGGLLNAVLDDPWVHQLGDVANALDDSEKRVKLPQGSDDPPGLPGLPLLPVPVPILVALALASYSGGLPSVIPAA